MGASDEKVRPVERGWANETVCSKEQLPSCLARRTTSDDYSVRLMGMGMVYEVGTRYDTPPPRYGTSTQGWNLELCVPCWASLPSIGFAMAFAQRCAALHCSAPRRTLSARAVEGDCLRDWQLPDGAIRHGHDPSTNRHITGHPSDHQRRRPLASPRTQAAKLRGTDYQHTQISWASSSTYRLDSSCMVGRDEQSPLPFCLSRPLPLSLQRGGMSAEAPRGTDT